MTRHDPARHIVDDAATLAAAVGANATTVVEHAANPAEEILAAAQEFGVDLIVISGTSRIVGDALFVGHTIQHVLRHAETTLVVALTPDGGERLPKELAKKSPSGASTPGRSDPS